MKNLPATIDLNPVGGEPTASVIWLHGLGADGNDFVPLVERFTALQKSVRFVFPHAPIRPITINGGMEMRAWYDIEEIDLKAREDAAGIQDSEKQIRVLIQRELDLGISPKKIVLAGFSQGGALALYTGLRYPLPLAGIIALSGYLSLPLTLENDRNVANQNTPIFMAHGLFDPMVPLMFGQMARTQLEDLKYQSEELLRRRITCCD